MNHSGSIIKQRTVASVLSEGEGHTPEREHPLRVRGGRIRAQHVAPAPHEQAQPYKRNRILRGIQARFAAVPYAMADLELEPDFPLHEVEPVVAETPEPLPDPEPLPEPDPVRYDELEAQWQVRLDEAVERARAEAYEEGYVAAEAALQASFDQRKAAMEEDVARLQAAWKEAMKKSEPLLASLAFEMVNQLLEAPLPQDVRAVSALALAQAIEQFGEDSPIEITLHPDDLSRLQAYGLTDDLHALHSGIRWDPNPDMSIGDWIAQSPEAAIRRLKDEMLNQLKSRLGLLAVMKNRDS